MVIIVIFRQTISHRLSNQIELVVYDENVTEGKMDMDFVKESLILVSYHYGKRY